MIPAMVPTGAAGLASNLAQNIRYQGRKASRQGSEQRRQDILDAAMRIVVREGVRGVRHRAVAAEASVPLSATTYYFNDIDDLLSDTFARHVERSAAYMAKLWADNEERLRQMAARGDRSPEARSRLADDVAQTTADYIQHQLRTRRDALIAEQAFRQEALLSPRLAELVRAHQGILLQGACQLLQVLGAREPEEDAQVLTAMIGRMEYQGLLGHADGATHAQRLGILKRYMHLVLDAA